MTPLSQAAVRTASAGDTLHDKEVPGLHLRVFPNRSVFYLYYRTKDGRQRRPSLGAYGKLTISQARDVARELLAKVALGHDPAGDTAAIRQSVSVAEYYQIWKAEASRKLKPSSRKLYTRLWKAHVIPAIGSLKLASVTRHDIEKLHRGMWDSPVQANRVLTLLSAVFNQAKVTPNPVAGVARNPERPRKAYLTPANAEALADALHRHENQYPQQVALFRLLAFTGARLREIMYAEREWIRGDKLHLPDSKTGSKEIYLPPQALAIIDTLPNHSRWILPSKRTDRPMEQPYSAWRDIRTAAGLPWLHIHDLRHSFASAAITAGYTLAQIGGLLGHNDPRTTQRYAHLMDDPAREAAKATADTIAKWMKK